MHSTLTLAASLVGCLLALAPAFLPATPRGDRWPHAAMALGMAAGHLGTALPAWSGVLILLAAGWVCGSPRRRALNGGHTPDFVIMAVLVTLTAVGGHRAPVVGAAPHAHGLDVLAPLSILLATAWTVFRLASAAADLRAHQASRPSCAPHLCSAGMAGSMALMATAH
ncbi:hypothetical protein GCM10022221_27170 [Actinocorallia aurea]